MKDDKGEGPLKGGLAGKQTQMETYLINPQALHNALNSINTDGIYSSMSVL